MGVIGSFISAFGDGWSFVQLNVGYVLALAAVYLILKPLVMDIISSSGRAMSFSGPKAPSVSQDDALRQARLEQQVLLNERAKEALKQRKAMEEEEEKRRNEKALHKKAKGGNRLGKADSNTTSSGSSRDGGTSSTRGGGYNPMQPWSSSQGSSYRPARRTVGRQ